MEFSPRTLNAVPVFFGERLLGDALVELVVEQYGAAFLEKVQSGDGVAQQVAGLDGPLVHRAGLVAPHQLSRFAALLLAHDVDHSVGHHVRSQGVPEFLSVVALVFGVFEPSGGFALHDRQQIILLRFGADGLGGR